MWTCPHCGAPQAEAARCWVCRRSSTTCSTCRHFRPSLTAELGYCGRDRRRSPLTGLELRGCWEEGPRRVATPAGDDDPVAPRAPRHDRGGPLDRPDPMRLRGFVPVEDVARAAALSPAPAPGLPPALPAAMDADGWPSAPLPGGAGALAEDWTTRTSLFGDAEG